MKGFNRDDDQEKILVILAEEQGNQTRAAKRCGVSKPTMARWVALYRKAGIEVPTSDRAGWGKPDDIEIPDHIQTQIDKLKAQNRLDKQRYRELASHHNQHCTCDEIY